MSANMLVAYPSASHQLEQFIQRGTKGRLYQDMLVTPELAQAMLLKNSGNRPITRSNVEKYLRRLRNGAFRLTPHGISFAVDGTLNDGQHRLLAIAESGIAGMMHVAFGCDRAEFKDIDGQKPRSAGDMLSIVKHENVAIKAAIAARLLVIDQRVANANLGQQEIFEYALTLDQEIFNRSARLASSCHRVSNPTVIGLSHYWIASRTRHHSKVEDFFALLIGGGFEPKSVAARLRDKLMLRGNFNPNTKQASGTSYNVSAAGAIVLAWNQWVVSRKKNVNLTWAHYTKLPEAR